MDLSTDTTMVLFGIDGRIYDRAEVIAEREGRTVTDVVEEQLHVWLTTEVRRPDRTYVVGPGDTLAGIATHLFGDPQKYALIAEYNGITEPAKFYEGQHLRIPAVGPAKALLPQCSSHAFRFPLDGIAGCDLCGFGSIYPPDSKWAGKPHPGVDLCEQEGSPVYAIGEGTVLVNRDSPRGYGHYLLIEHRLARTGRHVYSLYGHLKHDSGEKQGFRSPAAGTRLRGENIQIGCVGKTGQAGAAHLHFEIKKTPDLGIYAMLDAHNLHSYFCNPGTFLSENAYLALPARAAPRAGAPG